MRMCSVLLNWVMNPVAEIDQLDQLEIFNQSDRLSSDRTAQNSANGASRVRVSMVSFVLFAKSPSPNANASSEYLDGSHDS